MFLTFEDTILAENGRVSYKVEVFASRSTSQAAILKFANHKLASTISISHTIYLRI